MSDHIASKINHCSRLLVTVPPSTIMLYCFIVLFHLFSLVFVLPRVHFPDTEGKVARCLSNMYQVTIEARIEVARDWINHELSLLATSQIQYAVTKILSFVTAES